MLVILETNSANFGDVGSLSLHLHKWTMEVNLIKGNTSHSPSWYKGVGVSVTIRFSTLNFVYYYLSSHAFNVLKLMND